MNFQKDSKAKIYTDVPLSRFSTLQIGGPARYVAEPLERQELLALLEFRAQENIPMLITGRGSNLLFSDDGFPGLVVSLRKFEVDRFHFETETTFRASGGLSLFRASQLCQMKGLSGLEFVCHIPGTIGGAVVMNAGFGRPGRPYREVKDALLSITLASFDGKLRTLEAHEIEFEYRKSHIPEGIILDATFLLQPSTADEVQAEVKANFAYRNSVQDLRYPSAGSMFKNPKGTPRSSGQMIDLVGLKGTRVGGAMISERHGNFFLNVGQAKAQDMITLIDLAKTRVKNEFGVDLETEVKLILPELMAEPLVGGLAA